MLDDAKTVLLYEAYPQPLPPTAFPYGFLVKPLQAFLLSCLEFGNPTSYVPAVTLKAAFELFLSSYLGDEYRPQDVIAATNARRRQERRMPLQCSFRSRPGGIRVIDLPGMAFFPLLEATLASQAFRKALNALLDAEFACGSITASQKVLTPEFLPFVERVSGQRIPTVFNVGILPLSRPMPDRLLAAVDPRFDADPELSRATFPRFKMLEHANLALPVEELEALKQAFDGVSRAGRNRAKRLKSSYSAKLASLYAAKATSKDDPAFLDEDALARIYALAGVSPRVDDAS